MNGMKNFANAISAITLKSSDMKYCVLSNESIDNKNHPPLVPVEDGL